MLDDSLQTTYFINISSSSGNDIIMKSTDDVYIDFMLRVEVSYIVYISTHCCNKYSWRYYTQHQVG